MVFPRVILLGDVLLAARYLGVAKKWARQCFAARLSGKVYRPSAEVMVRVENQFASTPGQGICQVTIEALGEALCYQFCGSEGTLQKTWLDPAVANRYLPLVHWARVDPRWTSDTTANWKAKPLLSNLLEDSATPPRWPYNANPYYATRVNDTSPLIYQPVHQPDGVGIKVWRNGLRNATRLPWLATTWTEPTPYHAAYRLGGNAPVFPQIIDRRYDIAPTVFFNGKGISQVPDTDWYRGGALRQATDAVYGSRFFVVMVDIAHNFWCYPVGEQGAYLSSDAGNKANVEGKYAQSQAAPWPTWVTTFDVGRNSALSATEHFNAIQPCWVFSPAGDKAAVIAYHRDTAWADTYWTSQRLYPEGSSVGTVAWNLQEDWPGLVEVNLEVSLTGPNPEDFTFTVTLKQASSSTTDGVGYLAVAYVARDYPDLPNAPAYNELVTLTHEIAINPTILFRPSSDYDDPANGFTVQDADGHVLHHPPIRVVAEVKTEGRTVLSWLSAFTAIWERKDAFAATTLFTPLVSSLSDAPTDTPRGHRVSWQTHLNAMDLSTFSFVLGVSWTLTELTAGSSHYDATNDVLVQWAKPWFANAAGLFAVAGGEWQSSQLAGHSQLKPAILDLLNRTTLLPNEASYVVLTLGAHLDQATRNPAVDSALFADLWNVPNYQPWANSYNSSLNPLYAQLFGDITLYPAAGTGNALSATKVLHTQTFVAMNAHAKTDLGGALDFYGNPLQSNATLAGYYLVMLPKVFALFDDQFHLRPGLRWIKAISGGANDGRYNGYPSTVALESGETAVSGYPVGILLHSRFAISALAALNNRYAQLATHPNGSHAAFVGPVGAYTGTVTSYPTVTDPQAAVTSALLTSIEQTQLDVICVRAPNATAYRSATTTHVEQLAAAFQRTLTPEDYHYALWIYQGRLVAQTHTNAPNQLASWYAHHANEIDTQYYQGVRYAGAALLSPFGMGWMKHAYPYGSGNVKFAITLPTFNEVSLENCETPAPVSTPTPRLEGLFGPLMQTSPAA